MLRKVTDKELLIQFSSEKLIPYVHNVITDTIYRLVENRGVYLHSNEIFTYVLKDETEISTTFLPKTFST